MKNYLKKVFPNKFSLFILIAILSTTQLWATTKPTMKVIGLFKSKVIAMINGKQQVLKVGDTTSEGFTLIEASSSGAIFEHNGKKVKYNLSSQINSSYKAAKPEDETNKTEQARQVGESKFKNKKKTVRIELNQAGQYVTTIKINGKAITALVDTGANTISVNSKLAKQLHIVYKQGTVMQVNTASGMASGYAVILDEVSLSGIKVEKIAATVLEGDEPKIALLGMSFLQHVNMKFDEKTKDLEISAGSK